MRYAPTHLRSIRWACGLDVNEVSVIKEIQRKTPANAKAFLVGQPGKNTYVEKMGGYRIAPFHIWIESVNGEQVAVDTLLFDVLRERTQIGEQQHG